MLVLRPGALGDTLLALPALRALRRRFGRVILAAHGGAARLLADLGEVDEGWAFDDPRLGWVFGGPPPAEPVVAWMDATHAPGVRDALLVAPSRPSDQWHCAEHLVQTLAPLGIPPVVDAAPLRVEPWPSSDILVHPGSGSAAKNWPAEQFAELIQHLGQVRLIVGEADAAAADAVERRVGHALPRLIEPPLVELAQRLAGCRAYVGNDSGVSHLAGLVGARSFVLFGPTSPTIWRPLGPFVSVLSFEASPKQLAENVLAS